MALELDEKKRRILEGSARLFLKFGIKSMTMDDIARELAISKKTLYQYVKDKNDLLIQIIQLTTNEDFSAICEVLSPNRNAIDENFDVFKSIVQRQGDVPPNILFDLKKYHPDAYALQREYLWNFARKCMFDNMTKGIEEGYYREDINTSIVTTNYILMMMNIFENSEAFGKDVPPIEIYKEIFKYHVNAIASSKGRKYLAENYSSMNFNQ